MGWVGLAGFLQVTSSLGDTWVPDKERPGLRGRVTLNPRMLSDVPSISAKPPSLSVDTTTYRVWSPEPGDLVAGVFLHVMSDMCGGCVLVWHILERMPE